MNKTTRIAPGSARTAPLTLAALSTPPASPLITAVLAQHARQNPTARNHAAIAQTWAGVSVAQIDQRTVDAAIARRQSQRTARGGFISRETAIYESRMMLDMVRKYVHDQNLPKLPKISFSKFVKQPTCPPISLEQLKRIILACHGYRWNGSKMEPIADPKDAQEIVRKYRPLYRLIVIMALTGLSVQNATALHFSGDPNGEVSYVDLSKGLLYRRGVNTPRNEKLKRMPIRVSRTLLWLLKDWRHAFDIACARKGPRADFIIYYHLGKAYNRDNMQKHLRQACQRAGLSKIDVKGLQSTHAQLALQNGASLRALAMARGESLTTTTQNFKHFLPDFHQKPHEAFRRRPPSIR